MQKWYVHMLELCLIRRKSDHMTCQQPQKYISAFLLVEVMHVIGAWHRVFQWHACTAKHWMILFSDQKGGCSWTSRCKKSTIWAQQLHLQLVFREWVFWYFKTSCCKWASEAISCSKPPFNKKDPLHSLVNPGLLLLTSFSWTRTTGRRNNTEMILDLVLRFVKCG